jgi:outer membrane protein assembly factor BamB
MNGEWIGAAKKRAKLFLPSGGVNSMRAVLVALLVTVWTIGCIQPPRAVPRLASGEWVMRGGDARRMGGATEPAPSDPDVVWRKGAGRGLAAPLIVQEPLVLATTTSRSVVAIDAESGTQYWVRRFRGAVAGMALRQDDRVFVATGGREERVYALDIVHGRTVWSRQIGVVMVEPLVVDDRIYVANERGQLTALDVRSGDTTWQIRFGAAAAISPLPYGESVLIATREDTLFRVARADGRMEGHFALGATPSASPVVLGDRAILPLHSGDVIAVTLPALRESWRIPLPAPVLAPPVLGPDDSLYLLTRTADVWRVAADGGEPVRIASLGGATSGSFSVTRDGLLVGRLDGALFHVGFDGRIIWQRDLDDSIVAPAVAQNGAIYVPLLHGDVVKLR